MNYVIFISGASLPLIIMLVLFWGYVKNIKIYETFIEGAEEGIKIVLSIFPNLLAMMIAVNIFRHSGVVELIINFITPILNTLNIPEEIFPLLFLRPLSGSASLSYMNSIFNEYGPDSLIGKIASTIQGSTETTLYIVAVYFGAAGIKKYRYAVFVGLLADLAGFFAAIFICSLLF